MANRHRLGVALLVDRPVADEINGLRRAVGDGSLERIAPHLTLVAPVNVPASRLSEALLRLRAAAASCGEPLELTLGPPTSFLPANPILILEVGGDVERLRVLRDEVFVGPFERSLSWPWVPHVTLADQGDPTRIATAVTLLATYTAVVEVSRVVLLEAHRSAEGLRWRPLADAALAPRHVVGRGGLDLELTRGQLVDPEALGIIGSAGAIQPDGRGSALAPPVMSSGRRDGSRIVVTGRRSGAVVGVAIAWRDDAGGHVAVVVEPSSRHEGIGSHLLAHVEAAVIDAGWSCPVLAANGPAAFYRSRSRWSVVP